MLTEISKAIGISDLTSIDRQNLALLSPRHLPGPISSSKPTAPLIGNSSPMISKKSALSPKSSKGVPQPQFVVLDLSHVTFIDASAARGCFHQLSKMCATRNIFLCASGASSRVDWILRSHEVAFSIEEEFQTKLLSFPCEDSNSVKIILFETIYDALEFCEIKLLENIENRIHKSIPSQKTSLCDSILPRFRDLRYESLTQHSLPAVLAHFLGLDEKYIYRLEGFSTIKFHREFEMRSGEVIFERGGDANEFFIVLKGAVSLIDPLQSSSQRPKLLSGAGMVRYSNNKHRSAKTVLRVGSLFGVRNYRFFVFNSFQITTLPETI